MLAETAATAFGADGTKPLAIDTVVGINVFAEFKNLICSIPNRRSESSDLTPPPAAGVTWVTVTEPSAFLLKV
ncbi:unannotated protein [freshwater metagenome]|uniref:Unannotated protein n=1 Tax=freshwater metagenome TaxID=449393 RepID=A0A6J6QM04_9ZZZZ